MAKEQLKERRTKSSNVGVNINVEAINPEQVLQLLNKIREGTFKITKQKFRNVLKRSIGANKDYADGCWNNFRDAPLHYLCSRTPAEQALELIKTLITL